MILPRLLLAGRYQMSPKREMSGRSCVCAFPSDRTGKGTGELVEVLHNLVVGYLDLDGETQQVQIESFKLPSLPPSAWKQVAADEIVQPD